MTTNNANVNHNNNYTLAQRRGNSSMSSLDQYHYHRRRHIYHQHYPQQQQQRWYRYHHHRRRRHHNNRSSYQIMEGSSSQIQQIRENSTHLKSFTGYIKTDEDVQQLGEALRHNTILEKLHLNPTYWTCYGLEQGGSSLLRFISSSKSLTQIRLYQRKSTRSSMVTTASTSNGDKENENNSSTTNSGYYLEDPLKDLKMISMLMQAIAQNPNIEKLILDCPIQYNVICQFLKTTITLQELELHCLSSKRDNEINNIDIVMEQIAMTLLCTSIKTLCIMDSNPHNHQVTKLLKCLATTIAANQNICCNGFKILKLKGLSLTSAQQLKKLLLLSSSWKKEFVLVDVQFTAKLLAPVVDGIIHQGGASCLETTIAFENCSFTSNTVSLLQQLLCLNYQKQHQHHQKSNNYKIRFTNCMPSSIEQDDALFHAFNNNLTRNTAEEGPAAAGAADDDDVSSCSSLTSLELIQCIRDKELSWGKGIGKLLQQQRPYLQRLILRDNFGLDNTCLQELAQDGLSSLSSSSTAAAALQELDLSNCDFDHIGISALVDSWMGTQTQTVTTTTTTTSTGNTASRSSSQNNSDNSTFGTSSSASSSIVTTTTTTTTIVISNTEDTTASTSGDCSEKENNKKERNKRSNNKLFVLNLSRNKVGDVGALCLVPFLQSKQHCHLKELSLDWCKLTDVGVQAIVECFPTCHALHKVSMLSCDQVGQVGLSISRRFAEN